MNQCSSCSASNSHSSKFCSACGAALKPEFSVTVTQAAQGEIASHPSSPSDSSHHGRFLPGTKVADRYRIVSLLGKGGMGEVYRADDLKLGHTVALKFLPRDLAGDPQRLEYFHNEVRLTRQISHPNVCRVYDIGEIDGQHFLSMEYIDGEDLKILLRRIGRLPSDKGVQIAQQLCAGLAAAHDRGVLHRDLKPANIMIDGRGQVRITDFGLAKLADDGAEGEIAGTPAYMAPEQLTRGEATIQSDLYSLGLILYELFTGMVVHQTNSIPELIRAHAESSLSQPSQRVKDIDPTVERVILRCLEKDPADRPKSTQVVALALPGGDPLAAALAAGETPSPEMVAAAGGSVGLSFPVGSSLFAAVFLMLAAIPFIAAVRDDFHLKKIEKKPDAFEQDARDLIAELGYPTSDVTSVHGFQLDGSKEFFEYWYRQSPDPLVPTIPHLMSRPFTWRVTSQNPPLINPGMIRVRFDPTGRLIEFFAVPSLQAKVNSEQEDWRTTFSAVSGFEYGDLNDENVYEPPAEFPASLYADNVWTKNGQFVVATRRDQIVYFRNLNFGPDPGDNPTWRAYFAHFIQILLIFAAGLLALRHVRRGRADIKGALHISLYFFAIDMILWAIGVHHDGSPQRELSLALNFLVRSLGYALRIWLYYVALEPLIRRFWPDMLISWSRLLSGRFRNEQVGRDILIGCLWGAAIILASIIVKRDWERFLQPDLIQGGRLALAQILNGHQAAGTGSLFYLTNLLLIRALFRNNWMAAAAFTLLMVGCWGENWGDHGQAVLNFLYFASLGILYIRFGLLSAFSGLLVWSVMIRFPYGAPGHWCTYPGNLAIAVVLLLAGYAFYTSTVAPRIRELAR